jgi:uncharacterized protein YacL
MVLHLVRIMFLLVVLGISISLGFRAAGDGRDIYYVSGCILAPVVAAFLLVLGDMLWRRKRLHVLSGLFFGALAGLVLAYGLAVLVDLVVNVFEVAWPSDPVVQVVKAILGAAAVFMCVTFVLQTKDDFRFVIPYVEFAKESRGARPVLLDTSVIIDGRIADIADTGVLESEAIVPRFVLAELHAVADSEDKLKRNRGRRGLDVLDRLQKCRRLDVRIVDARLPDDAAPVDDKLVALAQQLNGRIVTNDFNLNKVAGLRGVDVININELANALKPVALPGEQMRLKIIRQGEEPDQGIGYLEDGTMVVVDQGREHIGQEATITVTSSLQTAAGRMIFGRLGDGDGPNRRRGHRT